ncbi:MAG: BatA and WFA domain-containing protein [Fimbriimonadaceae bacterium]|nr:BatA and WFA domain-containing protein [Fimbriimonadaceae bacterium]QYK55792.1 MAG: BatA and WFA domain-containing protein [Fimbriimonadaceae bacterium]
MNFQNPVALAWFLPLATVVVALYLLRMRRRNVRVPAVFLWPQQTEEVRANSLFQRLRFSWLLVLQLLALALVAIAFARPQVVERGLAGKVTVIVLDASASMGSTDVGPSRFEAARAVAGKMIEEAVAGDRLALIEAGPVPRVVFPLGAEAARQKQRLKELEVTDGPADLGEALRLAAGLVSSTQGAKIVVLSDGSFPQVNDFSPGQAGVLYQKFGQSGENLAVSSLGSATTASGRQAYCGVRNFGLAAAETVLTIKADGQAIDSRKVRVEPGQTSGTTVDVPSGAKVLTAEIENGGVLKADDFAVELLDPGANLRVLMVGKADVFLQKALSLDPRVTLDFAERLPESARPDGSGTGYDIVIFDGAAEEPVKARGVLTLGVPGAPSPAKAGGTATNLEFVSAKDHPLLRGVDFTGVYIETATRLEPKAMGSVLAETKSGPLLVVANGRPRQVLLGFSPLDSDFPLNVGFPIFVGNVLDYLGGKGTTGDVAVRVGQAFALPANGQPQARLRGPGGEQVELAAKDDRFDFRGLGKAGVYELTAGNKKRTVYAVLRDEEESDTRPRDRLALAGSTVTAAQSTQRLGDVWKPIVLLTLLVLACEWWLFARKS